MLFGVQEMREFAENHEDERVRILWRRMEEARSRNARWCQKVVDLEQELNAVRAETLNRATLGNHLVTKDDVLIRALRILSCDVQSDDGLANAVIAEAADRIEQLVLANEK